MKSNILILLGILSLIPTVDAALRASSMSQQDLSKRWQQYINNPGSVAGSHNFPYKECFRQSAKKYDLPESLLLAFARGESNFDPNAKSSANAYGLMQILWPSTAKDLGINSLQKLLQPCVNVDAGSKYIRQMLDRYQGDLHKAVAAYNYGPGRISVKGKRMPEGAAWYSDYILRHLDYVQDKLSTSSKGDLLAKGQILIITFDRPYRASAFIDRLQTDDAEYGLAYFRRADGSFDVVMEYDTDKQKRRGKQQLRKLGFRL